ncbi:S-layer homology domain-containing protein [Paenibacillus sp. MSJ-34]|uniref:S-layer homology domain-containing protein n=1 Tax=Paenibacillus sp. MSJ-34 TaxID=2841529 RepID=UPI001C109EC3|nr:S-layer homology domain-containing protein [Paenibacillus sp. MSJ-34]MBU5444845.1 S-layer homology domain-containing protein [Paenibacillus sp. MSJ-34]
MKKLICSLFMAALLLGPTVGVANAESRGSGRTFTDVSGHWAEAQIDKAIASGFVTGYSDGTFKPDAPVTGEQFIAMMVRALQLPVDPQKEGESWFAPVLAAAVKHRLYDNDFHKGWSEPLTRAEMAVTLERATRQQSYDHDMAKKKSGIEPLKPSYKEFDDDYAFLASLEDFDVRIDDFNRPEQLVADLREWYRGKQNDFEAENESEGRTYCSPEAEEWYIKEYDCLNRGEQSIYQPFKRFSDFAARIAAQPNHVRAQLDRLYSDMEPKQMLFEAVRRGLMTGTGPGQLSADSTTTRAQAVAVIERVLDYNAGKDLPVDRYALAAAEIAWHRTNLFTTAADIFNRPENNANTGMNSWTLDKLMLETPDGHYQAQVDRLIVVDMADPKDPNRKYLPPLQNLHWTYRLKKSDLEYETISNNIDAVSDNYIILLQSSDLKNTKPDKYRWGISLNISGFASMREWIRETDGNTYIETDFTKRLDRVDSPQLLHYKGSNTGKRLDAFIIPKKDFAVRDHSVHLSVSVILPAGSGDRVTSSNIVRSTIIQ